MNYFKNPITNLAIFLPLFLGFGLLLFCSWHPIVYKSLYFSQEHASNTIKSSMQKDELEVALEKASMANKTVIITIINKAYVEPHEDEYPTMFDLFLEGFWVGEQTRTLVNNLLVVAMDETAHQRCLFRRLNCYKLATDDGGDKFAGEKVYMSSGFIEMMWRRTFFLINVLKRGYNFIFTDTDVLWLRNPLTKLSKNESIDLQISIDILIDNVLARYKFINTGFYFIKSNNKTISLLETWYDKRKNSTGLKEQDVLVNLIRREGILQQLDLNAKLLDTDYFSGFCSDSKDVRKVTTVHANCCQTIRAKVVDLKAVLRDWKKFRSMEKNVSSSIDERYGRNFTNGFQWSRHVACNNSWLSM